MGEALPEHLRRFFWETDFAALSWEKHRDYIAGRILSAGNWQAIAWLRRRLGDEELRRFLRHRRGRGLSPQQLRFWEIVLDLPHDEVTAWIEATRALPWAQRLV